jgi:hypothetical protein
LPRRWPHRARVPPGPPPASRPKRPTELSPRGRHLWRRDGDKSVCAGGWRAQMSGGARRGGTQAAGVSRPQ